MPPYTSYPTAVQLTPAVQGDRYRAWLGEPGPTPPLSLYFHIPFCDNLCWFCGCHTKVVRRYAPIATYLDLLLRELDLVADRLPGRHRVCHVHLGGGTPTILAPDRVCLFGYAHVPWMKKHQRLIDEARLPDAAERFAQYLAAAERLQEAGYLWIGLDHFARPGGDLAKAARDQTLRRNFQGYTTDDAPVRLGFGPSAIGMLPQGLVQNEVSMKAYRDAIEAGVLPVARGLALTADDRLRGAVIERLMCFLEADPRVFAGDLAALQEMAADGLVEIDGWRVRVTEAGRPFLRTACAAFDSYLEPDAVRHAQAV